MKFRGTGKAKKTKTQRDKEYYEKLKSKGIDKNEKPKPAKTNAERQAAYRRNHPIPPKARK